MLAVSRKRVLVQQMQDKSDAIVEDINILLGETKTSKETMDALNALQKTFWDKIQSLVQDAVESERQGLNAEVEERIKMVLTRVDQNGDKKLTEKGIKGFFSRFEPQKVPLGWFQPQWLKFPGIPDSAI